MSAEELIARLGGGAGRGPRDRAALRDSACTELRRLEAEHSARGSGKKMSAGPVGAGSLADIAVACASPLCEVLSKPASEVDAEEYRRAALVLTALSGVDPVRVGGECLKPEQHNLWGWAASGTALGAALAKEPAALTRDDALVVACANAPFAVQWSTTTAFDSCADAAGISQGQTDTGFRGVT
jgi:hypothetical protein